MLLHPSAGEAEGASALLARIDDLLNKDSRVRLIGPDGVSTDIPPSVYQGLRLVAQAIANGHAVAVAPQDLELTTQQAADLLHVSRPHLIKLLDQGRLAFHRTSDDPAAHRRVMLRDVMEYRERRRTDRRESLRELSHIAQETEGGYR